MYCIYFYPTAVMISQSQANYILPEAENDSGYINNYYSKSNMRLTAPRGATQVN